VAFQTTAKTTLARCPKLFLRRRSNRHSILYEASDLDRLFFLIHDSSGAFHAKHFHFSTSHKRMILDAREKPPFALAANDSGCGVATWMIPPHRKDFNVLISYRLSATLSQLVSRNLVDLVGSAPTASALQVRRSPE
jgi:hypothetical protein